MPEEERPPERRPPPARGGDFAVGFLLLVPVLLLLGLWQSGLLGAERRSIPYSEFRAHLSRGEVVRVVVAQDEIEGHIVPKPAAGAPPAEPAPEPTAGAKPAEPGFDFRTARVEDPGLVDALAAAGIQYEGSPPSLLPGLVWAWLLPLVLLFLFWSFMVRRMGSPGASVMSFGKSRARLVADREVGVSFADVAGCDEAKVELQEVVEFLRRPERFTRLGAEIPRGLLLVGPPGTGKTLLARAVAGEAKVPFFSLSGSDFVEMFVGVGAARVRDLFEQAKRLAPCIVFIDELDAVGRQRGVRIGNVNDEREHTLNQLLVEMDGFGENPGVVILAATNRPDVLDPALLRPGRFDRQVVLDAPDLEGREAILRVHARGKRLAPDIRLRAVAEATPGFSGADLANAMNEAALLAARRSAEAITQEDLEAAVEKVVAGPERKSRRLSEEDKRRVAYHESGHAVVAAHSKHADPVRKISIVPRGRAALGYTLQLPTGDRYLLSRSQLLERLRGLLGGRAAEELTFAEVSTGAENDLEQATAIARQAVCQYGMGESVGLMHCARRGPAFLPDVDGIGLERDCSEATARAIDEEVKKMLDQAYAEAKALLVENRDQLTTLAESLLQRETLGQAEIERLLLSGAR